MKKLKGEKLPILSLPSFSDSDDCMDGAALTKEFKRIPIIINLVIFDKFCY